MRAARAPRPRPPKDCGRVWILQLPPAPPPCVGAAWAGLSLAGAAAVAPILHERGQLREAKELAHGHTAGNGRTGARSPSSPGWRVSQCSAPATPVALYCTPPGFMHCLCPEDTHSTDPKRESHLPMWTGPRALGAWGGQELRGPACRSPLTLSCPQGDPVRSGHV